MKMTILLTVLTVVASLAQAKSLTCDDGPSFTGMDFTINRDGSIGFNGTYITMNTQLGFDNNGGKNLSDITGRPEDESLHLVGLGVGISPKEACTNPDADLQTPFQCRANRVSVVAIGKKEVQREGTGIFDRMTVESRLDLGVEAELLETASAPRRKLRLNAVIHGRKRDVHVSIPVKDVEHHCKITNH